VRHAIDQFRLDQSMILIGINRRPLRERRSDRNPGALSLCPVPKALHQPRLRCPP
jgi:hypothetical protein